MTVAELREKLKTMPDDLPVCRWDDWGPSEITIVEVDNLMFHTVDLPYDRIVSVS